MLTACVDKDCCDTARFGSIVDPVMQRAALNDYITCG